MNNRKSIRLALIIFSIFIIAIGASLVLFDKNRKNNNISSNINRNKTINVSRKNNNENQNNKNIKDTIKKFIKSTYTGYPKDFKKMIDEYGIYSITYFIDKRDRNVVLHLYKNEIRDDLVLANSNKTGITVATMFTGEVLNPKYRMPIHDSRYSKSISFNVDWHKNDESLVQNKIQDIENTCKKLININNKWIPQVFIIKGKYIVYAESGGGPKTSPGLIGKWAIFEKKGKEYKLRVLIDFE